tara:strand:- start:37262 stop:37540 length:279 start_codon:yes stop_codon:yes gene_type:complete
MLYIKQRELSLERRRNSPPARHEQSIDKDGHCHSLSEFADFGRVSLRAPESPESTLHGDFFISNILFYKDYFLKIVFPRDIGTRLALSLAEA